jgi:diacylglycerol kinase (ATP)
MANELADGRPLLILNPKAGGEVKQRKLARLVSAVSAGLGEMDVQVTEARGHATELAHQAALARRGLVIAFGGDGTISEVAGGLLAAAAAGARDTELAIIPRGTGGDFRRTLELPTDITEAARFVRERPARAVDVGRATFTADDGGSATRHFVNVASFGFSSAVADRTNRSGKLLGTKAAYLAATVRTLFAYANTDVMLEIDGAPPVRRTLLLGALGNGRYFGGGMKICPDAALDSGQLSLVTVGDFGKMKVLRKIHRIFDGTHLTLDDVAAASVRTLRASPADDGVVIPIEMDGETPGRLPATFEVRPGALRIRY